MYYIPIEPYIFSDPIVAFNLIIWSIKSVLDGIQHFCERAPNFVFEEHYLCVEHI